MRPKPKFIVIDVETTGLNPRKDRLHGVGVAYEEDETHYFPAGSVPSTVLELLADDEVAKVGHNLRFDLKFLHHHGVIVRGKTWDTKVMASLLDENSPQGLKQLAEKWLGSWALEGKGELDRAISKAGCRNIADFCAKDLDTPGHPYLATIGRYCEEDCNNTFKLAVLLSAKLKGLNAKVLAAGFTKGPWDYFVEEAMPLEKILLDMELQGIRINQAAMLVLEEELQAKKVGQLCELEALCKKEIQDVEEELYQEAVSKRKSEKGKAKVERSNERYGTRFNWSSSADLGSLLFDKIGAPANLIRRTASGQRSTSDKDLSVLRNLCNPSSKLVQVLGKLNELKRVEKLLTTYVGEDKGLAARIEDGRVYPQYLQVGSSKEGGKGGTVTGRLSSQDPNIQNIPRGAGVKRFFVPEPGNVFVYADYSQLELRVAAHLSQDKEFLDAYRLKKDLHLLTACSIFNLSVGDVTPEQRQVGKTINFAMIYDAGAFRLAEELNKGGRGYRVEEVEAMRKAFFERFSTYKDFLGELKSELLSKRVLVSECGRVRRIPDVAYGELLDWSKKRLKGASPQQRTKLLHSPDEVVSEEEFFWRAKKKFSHAIKQGYNFPIQSLGASIAKRAMLALAAQGAKIVTQVHDSLIIEVPEEKAWQAAKRMQKLMEEAYPLSVPLVAETKILRSFDEKDLVQIPSSNKAA